MKKNPLKQYARTDWFLIEKEEYEQGYREEGFGHYDNKEDCEKYWRTDNNGHTKTKTQVFSRQIIDLDYKKAFDILSANPLECLKDLGFQSYTKTESIFKIIHDFYNYTDFFKVFDMRLSLPADYEYKYTIPAWKGKPKKDHVDKFHVPLQLIISIHHGNEVLAMMDDDQTGRIYTGAGYYNDFNIATFYYTKTCKDSYGKPYTPVPGSSMYIETTTKEYRSFSSEIKEEPVHNAVEFSKKLNERFFMPVFNILKKKEAIYGGIHRHKPSYRYFIDGSDDYLHSIIRKVMGTEYKELDYVTGRVVVNCILAQFMDDFAPNYRNEGKSDVKPIDFIKWLDEHPDKDWNFQSLYDFCIEKKCYELCEDADNFGNYEYEGVYTRTGEFVQAAHDLLFKMMKKDYAVFLKFYLKKRPGSKNSLVKEFASEIEKTLKSALHPIPDKENIRKKRKEQAEEEERNTFERARERKWGEIDDWD